MCGIAGIAGHSNAASAHSRVVRMTESLRHRGPDGAGVLDLSAGDATVVLGHRRLSIIDLSAAGSQPMSSADGSCHLVLNGEIYNFVELRAELRSLGHRFRGHSDSEVLVEAWAEWGPASLSRFIGMFAFALFDARDRTLYLVRDPFGMKPLYYAATGAALTFASEIPSLLDDAAVPRRADSGAVADYLAFGLNNTSGRTMFAEVREVPAAHYLAVVPGAPTAGRMLEYWRPEPRANDGISFAAAAAELRERFLDSIRLHLRSDVPVGTMLSGGVDSSSIVAAVRHLAGTQSEIHTFSYRASDGATDEKRWIDAASKAAHTIPHEIHLTPEEWATDFEALVRSQGEPFGSIAIYAQRRLFQLASEHGVRVVLDGQGADEYLAGYGSFHAARLASLLRPSRTPELMACVAGLAAGGRPWRGALRGAAALRWPALRHLSSAAPGVLDPHWLTASGVRLTPAWLPQGPEVLREALTMSLQRESLPWLLRYADRNAMAFSVENRLPFLNPELINFVLGLPERFFIRRDGVGKHVFREAMRGLVPDLVLDRRDKVGFDVPVQAWLAVTPGVPDLLEYSAGIPGVREDYARLLAGAARGGKALSRRQAFDAWRLVGLAGWAREFDVTFS